MPGGLPWSLQPLGLLPVAFTLTCTLTFRQIAPLEGRGVRRLDVGGLFLGAGRQTRPGAPGSGALRRAASEIGR